MGIGVDYFISVSITPGSRGLSERGFGIPLIFAYFPTSVFATRTKKYSGTSILSEMITDGFTANHPAYLMASALTSGDRKPKDIIVGRRANAPVQITDLQVQTTTDEISVTISYNGTTETYSVTGTGVPATDATALAADITAGAFVVATNITATGVGADVQIRQGVGADTGQIFYYSGMKNVKLTDVTAADPGIDDDITAIRNEDDSWWWALMDSYSEVEILGLATALSTLEKFSWLQTADYDCADNVAGNVMKDLKTAARARVSCQWSRYSMAEYSNCIQVGRLCTLRPGQWNAAWSSLPGATSDDSITSTEFVSIVADYGSVYVKLGELGANMYGGRTFDGGWADQVQLTDWLRDQIRTRLANVLIKNATFGTKIPYTDQAGEIAIAEIRAAFEEGARYGGFILDSFNASYTPASEQTVADKGNRLFNGVEFYGQYQGAVNTFTVNGRVE